MQLIPTDAKPRARRTDPLTSHEAAAAQTDGKCYREYRAIVACLTDHGPHGKDGIARLTGIDGVEVARRLTEINGVLVEPTGKRVASDKGCSEREWRAVAVAKDVM